MNGNYSELKVLEHLKKRYSEEIIVLAHCRTWNIFEPRSRVISEVIEALWTDKVKKVTDFFDKTEWDFVIAKEGEKGRIKPLLIVDYDGLCKGQIKNGEYVASTFPKKVNHRLRKIKFDDKIKLTREIGLPFVITPPIVDEHLGIDWGGENVWLLDFVIGCLLADIDFDQEWDKEQNWEAFRKAKASSADRSTLQSIVDQTGVQLEVSSNYKFIPLFKYEGQILRSTLLDPDNFGRTSIGVKNLNSEGKETTMAFCSVEYRGETIEGTHPLLDFESNLGGITRLSTAVDALCWYKVARQIWPDDADTER